MSTRIYDDGTIEGYAGRAVKKIYLAGPMRGIPEFNFPAFRKAAEVLRNRGYEVWSPHERDEACGFNPEGLTGEESLEEAGFSLGDALADDLSRVAGWADTIALLPGWEHSLGVRAELAAAAAIGKTAATVVALTEHFPIHTAEWFLARWGRPVGNPASTRQNPGRTLTDQEAGMFAFPPGDEPRDGLFETEEDYYRLGRDEVRVTSSSGGQKGMKPARFDLLPWDALWTVAELYGKGAEKYEDRNWERGYDWSLSFASLIRHATQFWQGEDDDSETGLPHLASVVFHALGLLRFMREHPEFDNRPSTLAAIAAVPMGDVIVLGKRPFRRTERGLEAA